MKYSSPKFEHFFLRSQFIPTAWLMQLREKQILLNRLRSVLRTPDETIDVILDEIADGLAGWDAGHG